MTMLVTRRSVLRSKRGFFAPAAWLRPSSGTANACLPSCPTPASATSARSCGRKDTAPMDGLRVSKDGTMRLQAGALCVALTPSNLDEVFPADLSGADCVEIRLDYLKNPRESVLVRWDKL